MPTFSYAQAAKGFSSPAPTKAAESTKSTQSSDQNKSGTQPIANGSVSSMEHSTSSDEPAEAEADLDKSQPMERKDSTKESLTVSTDGGASTKNTVSGATSPSYGTASSVTLPKEDDISFTPNGTSESTWDKQSEVSGPVEKTDQSTEASTEKSSESGAAKSASTTKELKAAPIPTVNVWQQRMETQNAKAKTNTMPKSNGTLSKTAAKGANASQQTASESQFDSSKGANKKKMGDGTSETKDRRRQADGGKFKDDGKFDCS